MPNISFDIFFDKDFINVTATRGHTAPKAKPEWKVRTAPKLPPKPVPEDHSGAPRPPAREKLTSTRQSLAPPKQSKAAAGDSSDAASQTSEKAEKRKPPKLGAKNVGEGINSSIRRYGDGVKDYGNAVMDWTSADSVRASTAANPLGLSAGKTGGKRGVTSPSVYTPVGRSTNPSKTLMTTNKTQKKIEAGTPRKALPAPGPKPVGAKKAISAPPPKSTPAKTSAAPNPGALRKKPAETNGNAKKPSSVSKSTPVKPAAPKTATAGRQQARGNPTAAANPLGLSF
ncbi:hypothetical protein LTR47_003603 [Exophiala xenobiotica]|nr:hypothetical protein LTR92_008091 [Exophiala xenobiotica]KAK5235418.1 hypothetical protein LTR47_003603 [Exophiala xenobiotica]KAK5245214.1 hypothetical protein LTS06_009309 [Exophiala xenobiotica]KAK5259714.1 hypothetical protein LTR40_005456 [Exophiala xenobiotica]KAK5347788.1 hypothetical protein LTR61_008417 [Exophiala xenobiotica]